MSGRLMPHRRVYSWACVVFTCFLSWTIPADAAVIGLWDEAVDGDLSDASGAPNLWGFPDPVSGGPTQLGELAAGIGGELVHHRLQAVTGVGDGDFFTIEIGPGNQLREILFDYDPGNAMFIAASTGDTFANTYDDINWDGGASFNGIDGVQAGDNWLGGAVLGDSRIGTDVLDDILGFNQFGVIQLTAPLGPGKYTFLAQQTFGSNAYTLDFGVAAIPEPSSVVALVGVGGIFLWRNYRRRRHSK